MSIQILAVDDDPLILDYSAKCLAPYGRVFKSQTLEHAQAILSNNDISLAVIDLNLSDGDQLEGLTLVETCRRYDVVTVVLSSHVSPSVIAQAYGAGCHHYFSKDALEGHLSGSLGQIIEGLQESSLKDFFSQHYLTQDTQLQENIRHLSQLFRHGGQRLFISGPTGVGKTYLAQKLHELHFGSTKPFIAKNLNEMASNLLESELFGHKKGAFTGADQDKVGLLELAHGGTLFLDEIGSLPLPLQQKLLKVIDEKKFTPVGSNKQQTIDFQLVTATCENLEDKINNGDLRLDFYFRIKGTEIAISPLSERPQDIELYLDHFIAQSPKKIAFQAQALNLLKKYCWPGNVRELEGLVHNLIASGKGLIKSSDLPVYIQRGTHPLNSHENDELLTPAMKAMAKEHGLPELIKKIEQEVYELAFTDYGDKVNQMVHELKVSKSVYYRLARDYEERRKACV